ncbi:hypothetical protein [Streptomyces arboris]
MPDQNDHLIIAITEPPQCLFLNLVTAGQRPPVRKESFAQAFGERSL